MKCCNCGEMITNQVQVCPSCGMRLKEYRQLVYLSNNLYNSALEQARRKDLTGAVSTLKRCLELNKRQTQARNLYGLILFQLGEVGEAARQWKLSMAFDPQDRQSAELYKKAFANRNELARMNDAVQKYNQALRCVKEGSLDLAMVHLKKVTGTYPHYARAVKLMALICIRQQDYARASRVLKPLLAADSGDLQAASYMEEVQALAGNTLKSSVKEQEERETREKQEVIIPPYSEKNELLHDFICIAGGLLLGVLACMFLIFPSVKQQIVEDSNEQIMSYGEDLSSKEITILSLETQIEELNNELEETQNSLEAYTGENGIMDAYADLITAMTYYIDGDYLNAVKTFTEINTDVVSNTAYQTAYDAMSTEFEENGVTLLYQEGRSLYNQRNYDEAKEYFLQCLVLKEDYPEVMYWLGLCYINTSDTENAQKYMYALQQDYEDTVWARYAKKYMPYTPTEETSEDDEEG